MIVNNARARAKAKGLPFDITVEDIHIPETCPALGIPLIFEGGRSDNSPALDRIVPELGYVKGNIIVISDKANRIKTNATAEEVKAVATWLKHRQNLTEG